MSTSCSQYLPSPGAKRQRHSTSKHPLTNRTFSPLPPSKKTKNPFKSVAKPIIAYWDNLSQIHLTQGALNELDRRAFRSGRITVEGQSGLSSKEFSNSLKHASKLVFFTEGSQPSSSGPNMEMDRIRLGDHNFGQHLEDHGVYFNDGFITKPANLDEISRMMKQPRPAPIPSESYDTQYGVLNQVAMKVQTKNDVMRDIFPLITGPSKFYSARNHTFGNLDNLTNSNIVKLQPDIYDGADASNLDPQILKALHIFLQPLAKKKCPVVPNFFGMFKGPKTGTYVGEQQAQYAGAIGARAIHILRSLAVEDPEMIYDNNAYTITAIYQAQDGNLKLYAHCPIKPPVPNGSMEYRMTLIGCFPINLSPDDFRRGLTAFRNAREWAMQKRNKCIAAANSKAQRTATA